MEPAYYAANAPSTVGQIIGSGFSVVPDDAVVLWSDRNDRPLQYVGSFSDRFFFEIVSKTSTRLDLRKTYSTPEDSAIYISAIVSADHSQVYWTNTTSPLP